MAQSGADDKHVNGGLSQCTDGAGGLPSPRSWQRPHGQNSTSSLLASGVIIISTSTSNSAYRYTFLHSVVCLSSVTHSCTLLKPFDALRCHHSRLRTKTMPATVGSKDTFVLDGGPSSEGEIWGSTPQQKDAIANCCFHLAKRNEEQFRLFPNYVGLVLFWQMSALDLSQTWVIQPDQFTFLPGQSHLNNLDFHSFFGLALPAWPVLLTLC